MTKNDQRIFFDLLRAENSKILYIVLAFLISFFWQTVSFQSFGHGK